MSFRLDRTQVVFNGRSCLNRGDAVSFLRSAATRKERGSGSIRALERELRHTGFTKYRRTWEVHDAGMGALEIKIKKQKNGCFSVECRGRAAGIALNRANGYRTAFEPNWKKVRKAAYRPKPQPKEPQTRIPRLQYPNRDITFEQAVRFIAYAHHVSVDRVRRELVRRNFFSDEFGDDRPPRYRIVLNSLPMEIEFRWIGKTSEQDLVRIFCVKDNRHKSYRKLRWKLKRTFHAPPKRDKEERRFLRLQRRLAAL